MQIGTNSIAQTAVRAIHLANSAVATASERISTGFRINRTSDDPAGMALGNQLKTQITSMSRAIDNVNQGVAMTQIVDSSLSQIVGVLDDMYSEALAAAGEDSTSSNYADLMSAHDTAIGYYADAIDRIAANASWNGSSLMTSSGTSKTIQYGTDSGQTLTINFDQITASVLGVDGFTVNSYATASSAMTDIKDALDTVYAAQSKMGAMANAMAAQSNVLTNVSTAYSSAYGNIMNADLAQETANLATAQIQRDGATAMLAQANGMNKELVSYLLKSVTGT